jgi:hypothetical protein
MKCQYFFLYLYPLSLDIGLLCVLSYLSGAIFWSGSYSFLFVFSRYKSPASTRNSFPSDLHFDLTEDMIIK